MSSSDQESFYVTLTSDQGTSKLKQFKDSDFTVQLSHEINIIPSQWEVGLASFTYPHDFNTVGANNLIALRYREAVHEIEIPVWNCPTIKQLAEFLDVEINKKILQGKRKANEKTRPVRVDTDSYNRVSFSFDTCDVDIGFAENTAEILGFSSQKKLSLLNFRNRQNLRNLIKVMLKKGQIFNVQALEKLQTKIVENPEAPYTHIFFADFLNALVTDTTNQLPFGGPKQALFQTLTGGIENPFEQSELYIPAAIETSSSENINKRKTSIEVNSLLEDSASSTRAVYELPVDQLHLIWLKRTPFADMFNLKDLSAFIQKFENLLPTQAQTHFSAVNHLVKFSGLYTEAVASYIAVQFLKAFKLPCSVLFGSTQACLNTYELMYIYLDIIKPEPFNSMMSPLLEIIRTSGIPGSLTQYRARGDLQYKSLVTSSLTNLRILIASRYGAPMAFLRGPTELQLHFRKKLRLRFN